ncbi:MAG: hypothetical protein P9X22_09310 [Candidatus Zapsychrus exili]|nr:hypothetical protein [Candidatus Zapsychrus exili]
MFRRLNYILRNNYFTRSLKNIGQDIGQDKRMRSSKGQIALLLVLVIAIALIFYAVSLNLGKVSQTKTMVTIASNVATGYLASQMASWGQAKADQLEGKRKHCALTGVVAAIVGFVILIIAIVLMPESAGLSAGLIEVSIGLAVAAIVIELVWVNPQISSLWDRIMANSLSQESQFSESSIQKALQNVITDQVQVPDLHDDDMDQVWWADAPNGSSPDMMSRYAYYYKTRLNRVVPRNWTVVSEFLEALGDFIYYRPPDIDPNDDWGLMDSENDCNPLSNSECQPCCVSADARDADLDCSSLIATYGSVEGWCSAHSPYSGGSTEYPYIYNPYPFFEKIDNSRDSLRELIGRDDENTKYYADYDAFLGTQLEHGIPDPDAWNNNNDFHIEDTVGFYNNDNRKDVFSFFHQIAENITDWNWGGGVDLNDLAPREQYGAEEDLVYLEQCNWCDRNFVTPAGDPLGNCRHRTSGPGGFELGMSQLALLNSPDHNASYCVEGTEAAAEAGNPLLAVDKFTVADGIQASKDSCPEAGPGGSTGFWKPGSDQFCSNSFPYPANCAKHSLPCDVYGVYTNCPTCEASPDKTLWRDDMIDDFLYNFQHFFKWASFSMNIGVDIIRNDFVGWYDSSAEKWIDETSNPEDNDNILLGVKNNFTEMARRLKNWKNSTEYIGNVWCVPSNGTIPLPTVVPPYVNLLTPEEEVIDNAGNRGTLGNIIACLNWNISGGSGIVNKMNNCTSACQVYTTNPGDPEDPSDTVTAYAANQACYNLPTRSLSGINLQGQYHSIGSAVPGDTLDTACADSDFLSNLSESAHQGVNQTVKFQKRREFLSSLEIGLDNAIVTFNYAAEGFADFLESDEVAALKEFRADFFNVDDFTENSPYQLIYGWKDDESKVKDPLWHLVRVDARLPKKCDQENSSLCGNWQWPDIDEYTKGIFATTRCYELKNHTGGVKIRVTRYDESPKTGNLIFPNGVPIWDFKYKRSGLDNTENIPALEAACLGASNDLLPPILAESSIYKPVYQQAFILNKADEYPACWNKAMDHIKMGVMTETCAQYFWLGPDYGGSMNLKFVPCPGSNAVQ